MKELTWKLFLKSCLTICIFFAAKCYSQLDSSRIFAFENVASLRQIIPIDDGYLFCGQIKDTGFGANDALIARLDKNYKQVWCKIIGDEINQFAFKFVLTDDDHLLVLFTSTDDFSSISPAIMKMSLEDGEVKWYKTYQKKDYNFVTFWAYKLENASNGNYFIHGTDFFDPSENYNQAIIEIDNDGNIVRSVSVDCEFSGDLSSEAIETKDGGYLLTGAIAFNGAKNEGETDAELIKVDKDGNVEWARLFGSSESELVGDIRTFTAVTGVTEIDNGYLFFTATQGAEIGGIDIILAKFDLKGDTVWTRVYGTDADDVVSSRTINVIGPNEFALAIDAKIKNGLNIVFTFDSLGNVLDQYLYGGDSFYSMGYMYQDTQRVMTVGVTSPTGFNEAYFMECETFLDFCMPRVTDYEMTEQKGLELFLKTLECTTTVFDTVLEIPFNSNDFTLSPRLLCSKYTGNPTINSTSNAICSGDSVTLSSSITDVYWSKSDQPDRPISSQDTLLVSLQEQTTYYLTRNDNGKRSSIDIEILDDDHIDCVSISIFASDTLLCQGDTVVLSTNVIDDYYQWSAEPAIDNQFINDQQEIAVSVDTTQLFTLTLSNGRSQTKEVSILPGTVETCINVSVFELITPNGDGANDVFYINQIDQFSNTLVQIFGINGQLVFEDNDYKNNWDGGGLPDGEYLYHVYVEAINRHYRGEVIIQR